MLRLASYDIVFQEIPGEVTLALNISGCPNRCPGCHSPHLQGDVGEDFDWKLMDALLAAYGDSVTCVCFMGGDARPQTIQELAQHVRRRTGNRLKTAWYSGRSELPHDCPPEHFDFIKLGPYVERLGGLDSPTSNQRLYRIERRKMVDITTLMRR